VSDILGESERQNHLVGKIIGSLENADIFVKMIFNLETVPLRQQRENNEVCDEYFLF
jgi:hypothetical protein